LGSSTLATSRVFGARSGADVGGHRARYSLFPKQALAVEFFDASQTLINAADEPNEVAMQDQQLGLQAFEECESIGVTKDDALETVVAIFNTHKQT
jgi:hypothetical protein